MNRHVSADSCHTSLSLGCEVQQAPVRLPASTQMTRAVDVSRLEARGQSDAGAGSVASPRNAAKASARFAVGVLPIEGGSGASAAGAGGANMSSRKRHIELNLLAFFESRLLGGNAEDSSLPKRRRAIVFFFCLAGPDDGVGRVGLGPLVGFSPLFTPEFSQQKKKISAEITMSTLPKWVIWCL